MVKICTLFSGSSGNAAFVSTEDNEKHRMALVGNDSFKMRTRTNLLIDCGMSGKQTEIAMNSIGETLKDIHGLLITHEHSDHMKGIGVLTRRYNIPVYLNLPTWERIKSMSVGKIPEGLINIIYPGKDFGIGDLQVTSFPTPHDAAESSGYKIKHKDRTISVFTDIGEINDNLLRCVEGSDAVLIESNHDEKMLWEGKYPYMLKKRIAGEKGHLSNIECARGVVHLLERGTTRFILSHLSKDNNLPSTAQKETVNALDKVNAVEGRDYLLQVARRSCAGVPWNI